MASLRLNISKFLVTACIIVAGYTAHAQGSQVKQEIKTIPVTVRYAGTHDNYMSFIVRYDNLNGDKFEVMVRDDEGMLLYRNTFTDKVFGKTFELPKTENAKATFIIKNLATNEVHSFEANTRLTEEMVVTRVD